ncbi:MAG: hypothetical protein KDN22_00845 [Verrucomicrobiae bacterium]|nr:hypothetical protein [Verrucomicrobiae bacterium]
MDPTSTGAPHAKPTEAKSREVLDAPEPDRRDSSLPGKGGSEHRALQNLIKSAAQFVGFRATVEKDIGSGMNVDVVAEDDAQRIAIEISVSTPSAHEIGNIRKCLEAGFDHVIFACADAGKLNIMSKLVEREFPSRSNVHCVLTGNVGDLLRLAKGAPPSPTASTDPVVAPVSTPGMKLSHSTKVENPAIAAEQRKAALKKLTKAMQR